MSAPTSRAVILLRQQDRLLTARKRFHDAAVRLAVRLPDTRVLAAYLTPSTATDRSLDTAVRDLVGEGAREVTVVPYLVEWDHPEAYDVPDVLYDLAEDYPEITFRMGSPLGIDSDLSMSLKLWHVVHQVRTGPLGMPDLGTA
jgi:sirohydrochlorin ferrochelatase